MHAIILLWIFDKNMRVNLIDCSFYVCRTEESWWTIFHPEAPSYPHHSCIVTVFLWLCFLCVCSNKSCVDHPKLVPRLQSSVEDQTTLCSHHLPVHWICRWTRPITGLFCKLVSYFGKLLIFTLVIERMTGWDHFKLRNLSERL